MVKMGSGKEQELVDFRIRTGACGAQDGKEIVGLRL